MLNRRGGFEGDRFAQPSGSDAWRAKIARAIEDGADPFRARFATECGGELFITSPIEWACSRGGAEIYRLMAKNLDRSRPWGNGVGSLEQCLCMSLSTGLESNLNIPQNVGSRAILASILEESSVWRHQPLRPADTEQRSLCDYLATMPYCAYADLPVKAWRHLAEPEAYPDPETRVAALIRLSAHHSIAPAEAAARINQALSGRPPAEALACWDKARWLAHRNATLRNEAIEKFTWRLRKESSKRERLQFNEPHPHPHPHASTPSSKASLWDKETSKIAARLGLGPWIKALREREELGRTCNGTTLAAQASIRL